MPHVLNITDEATSTSLTTNGVMLGHYVPKEPAEKKGGGYHEYDDVTDTIEVTFTGPATTNVQAKVNEINRWLVAARRRAQEGVGNRVFLQFRPINDPATWRSELLGGVVRLDDKAMTVYGQAKVQAQIIVTRRPWWEAALTELAIASKASASPATGGKSIHNHNDASQGNYIEIADTQVTGDLPAPVKLQLTNTTGSSQDYRNFYLGTETRVGLQFLANTVEGETVVSGGSTVGSQPTASNDAYRTFTFSGTTEVQWNLASSVLQRTAGRRYRVLCRFMSYSSTPAIFVQAVLRDAFGLLLLDGDKREFLLPSSVQQLHDLGTLRLPPGGYSSLWAAMRLGLRMRAASSVTVAVDFFQLFAVESFQHIVQRGMQVLNGDSIVFDNIEQEYYLVEAGERHPIYTVKDDPLLIFPNQIQRIYLLHDEGSSLAIGNTFTVRAWYRPRRLTI